MNLKKLICAIFAAVAASSMVSFGSFAFKEPLKLDYMGQQPNKEDADKRGFDLNCDADNCNDKENCGDKQDNLYKNDKFEEVL